MTTSGMPFESIITPIGYSSTTCGYCSPPGKRSSAKTSHAFGIWAQDLSPNHYQQLIDAGWRRSGRYIYKPDLASTCCKQISIRLQGERFEIGRSARKSMKRFVQELRGTAAGEGPEREVRERAIWGKGKAKGKYNTSPSLQEFFSAVEGEGENTKDESAMASTSSLSSIHQQRQQVFSQWRKSSSSSSSSTGQPRPPPPLQPSLVPTLDRKLTTRLVPGSCTEDKYTLFRRYQASIHKESDEDISSLQGFKRFLCESPVRRKVPYLPGVKGTEETHMEVDVTSSDPIPFGLYHLEWWLDDQLIAVGVLDLLPKCLSSVYFFYDPTYEKFQLGKISVLREIALLERIRAKEGMREVEWYYLGYYIHTCQKMRYKGHYRPSQVLDVIDNQWMDFQDALPVLQAGRGYDFHNSVVQEGQENGDAQESRGRSEEAASPSISRSPSLSSSHSTESTSSLLPASQPPFPGILDVKKMDLFRLSTETYVLEAANQLEGTKPLISSRLVEREKQKVREAVAAIGWEMASHSIFFL